MALIIEASYIVRKQELIRKKSKNPEGLTSEEETELKEIEAMVKKVNDELLEFNAQGVKLRSGVPIVDEEEEKKKSDKPKMKPAERKEKAMAIIEEMRARKADDKEIIVAISADLGVSNTYGYKLVKGIE